MNRLDFLLKQFFMKHTVAIQGFEGSFHQYAAQQYFGQKVSVVCCPTFRGVIQKTTDKTVTSAGLMAIENSIAGSILPNYSLLKNSGLVVTGEVYLKIAQQLIGLKGASLKDIQEVHSHPIAILQCSHFLEKQTWQIVETEDTALSVKRIAESKTKHIAGIAGSIAADIYDMQILAKDINTMKENFTRFLVLQRKEDVKPSVKANKISLSFEVENRHGSLSQVLTRIHYRGMNLTKLQSFPIPGSKWNYFFHCDMEFSNRKEIEFLLEEIKSVTKNIQVYGIYEKGLTH